MRRALVLLGLLLIVVPVARLITLKVAEARTDPGSADEQRIRNDALARAQVFVSDASDIASLDLAQTPRDPEPFATDELVTCQYEPKELSGTTPKFDCKLADGRIVKVKYGVNPELPAELAATRLLAALGFSADRMSLVKRLHCEGCSWSPFRVRQITDWFFLDDVADRLLRGAGSGDFDWVAVERKTQGRAIVSGDAKGWNFYDLSHVHENQGGAPRSHIDALRLMAVLLAHWDNKSANQRLTCRDEPPAEDHNARCQQPVVMLQDLGASFGPRKVNHANWTAAPIWKDAATCLVSMETLPYGGATFAPVTITEGGRALIASRLKQLSEAQVTALFTGARFPDAVTGETPARDVSPWVKTFLGKVSEIADRPACPQ
jgi:hypothetical protein